LHDFKNLILPLMNICITFMNLDIILHKWIVAWFDEQLEDTDEYLHDFYFLINTYMILTLINCASSFTTCTFHFCTYKKRKSSLGYPRTLLPGISDYE
jgi:hypothetical protein